MREYVTRIVRTKAIEKKHDHIAQKMWIASLDWTDVSKNYDSKHNIHIKMIVKSKTENYKINPLYVLLLM